MRIDRHAATLSIAFILLIAPLTSSLMAQGGIRPSPLDPQSAAQREMQAREWALNHVPDEVNKHFKKERVSLFAQIREDFTRIQLINNEMMQTVFVQKNIDKKLIAATSAEINKRATRLKENLVLPRVDEKSSDQKPESVANYSQLQARLLALDTSITSFVANPLFKEPKVIDQLLAVKARRDLG